MKKCCLIMIVGLLMACGKPSNKEAELTFRHLTTGDGLADNEVKAIWQREDVLMRIETATGINLYDGHQVMKDTISQSRQSSGHDFTYKDLTGTLWKYSTLQETISFKAENSWQQVELSSSDKRQGNYIRGIQDAGEDQIWIATDHQGLYLYNKRNGL